MSHLGRWLSALVDGELDGEERDRVLNHVAGCAGCRQEANAMRALKRRLTALGQTSAEPAIASRLMDLASVSRPREDALDLQPAGKSGSSHSLPPGVRLLAASAGTTLAAIGVVAFLLGSTGSAPAPRVTPSVDSFLLQHAYDAGQAPAGSSPVTVPASPYRHGSTVPRQAPAFAAGGAAHGGAASGATARGGTSHGGTAHGGTVPVAPATSGAATSPAAGSSAAASPRQSPTPMVSQHRG